MEYEKFKISSCAHGQGTTKGGEEKSRLRGRIRGRRA